MFGTICLPIHCTNFLSICQIVQLLEQGQISPHCAPSRAWSTSNIQDRLVHHCILSVQSYIVNIKHFVHCEPPKFHTLCTLMVHNAAQWCTT